MWKPWRPRGMPGEASDRLIVLSALDFPDGQGPLIVSSLRKAGGRLLRMPSALGCSGAHSHCHVGLLS